MILGAEKKVPSSFVLVHPVGWAGVFGCHLFSWRVLHGFSGGAQYQFMTFDDILLVPLDAFPHVQIQACVLSVMIMC